ncbi:diguanylate cyclase [Caldinitratiruptor microaerophilus]|uniref:Diguanylate cyclase n=1 Tax=Caldinitratiruptor microaerophilus TaxID=671077 RepID=A0AA35CKY6_9FIRM|nr:diguanylate cyclase [Caldinitratiruptor microaerophilus]
MQWEGWVTVELDWIRTLYEYNEWANRRVLSVARLLDPEAFTRDLGSSYRSVQGTLRHIMDIEALWLSRWKVAEFPGWTRAADVPDVTTLEARWEGVARRLQAFVAGLTPADLGRIVAYTDTRGMAFEHPLWVQLINLVNHGTHHRGQLATLFRQLGVEPLQNDLVYFHAERAAGR